MLIKIQKQKKFNHNGKLLVVLFGVLSLSLSKLSNESSRRNEPTIERAVDAALTKPPTPSPLELLRLLLLCAILTGFSSAQIFNANFNSAMNASPGVIYQVKNTKITITSFQLIIDTISNKKKINQSSLKPFRQQQLF